MNRKALTVIELVVAMVLTGILGLVMTIQFVSEQRFRASIQNDLAALQEAQLAMNHMTRVLRFACGIDYIAGGGWPSTSTIDAEIEGSHLNLVPNRCYVRYQFNAAQHTVEYYDNSNNTTVTIARNIQSLHFIDPSGVWDERILQYTKGIWPFIQIAITSQTADGKLIYLYTSIKRLPNWDMGFRP